MKKKKIKNTNEKNKSNKKGKLINESDNFVPRVELGNYSETIIKIIIDKLISLSICQSHKSIIEKELPTYCYNKIQNSIQNLLKTYYLNYDEDDFYLQNEIKFDEISISKEVITNNHSSNLTTERNLNNLIENNNDDNVIESNILIEQEKDNNFWNNIPQPKNCPIDRSSIYKNDYTKFVLKEESIIKDDSFSKSKVLIKRNSKIYHKYIPSVKIEEYENLHKKKKNNINLSFHPIDKTIIRTPKQIEQDQYFANLRKEYDEINNKVEEENLKKEKEKLNEIIKKKELTSNIKNKKFTIDPNGKIVIIKQLNNNQLKKEFHMINSNTKDLKQISSKLKYKEFNENIPVEKNMHIDKYEDELEEKKKFNPRNAKLKKFLHKKLMPIVKQISNNNIEIHKKKPGEKMIISGSSFDFINPEVGVKIIENEKIKSGGKNFYIKYNKYSLENYNNLNKYFQKEHSNNDMIKTNDIFNFNSTLIQRNSSMDDLRNKTFSNNNTNVFNKNFSNENINNLSNSNSNEKIEEEDRRYENFITTIKNKSLKTMIENANLINENQLNESKPFYTKTNYFKIFKNSFSPPKNKYDLNGINTFNKLLLNNTDWGIQKNELKIQIPSIINNPFKVKKEKKNENKKRIRVFLPSMKPYQDNKLMKSSSTHYISRANKKINAKTINRNHSS